MNVLIADDDRVLVHMLGAEFRKQGWTVVQAFDAMQALMFAGRDPQPDVVVLDLGMPGGTGYGVLERLGRSARTASIPVVVVTGTLDADAEAKARERGAIGFFLKPVEPAGLVAHVQELVGTPGE